MRLIIIGSKGYIGSNLLTHFANGYDTYGIGRFDKWPEFTSKDTIINCAASGWAPGRDNVWEAVVDNVLLVKRIMDVRNGANLIQFCSGFESARPTHPYSRTKGIASDLLRGSAHLVYLYTVFGGHSQQMWRFIPSLLDACATGKPYTITTPYTSRDFVHIRHLFNLVERLITHRNYGETQLGTGNARRLIDVYSILVGSVGKSFPNVSVNIDDKTAFDYRADNPAVDDTFPEDLKREWEQVKNA